MKLKLFQGQNSEPQEYLKLKNKENENKRPESGKKIRIGVSVERPNSAFHKILARKMRYKEKDWPFSFLPNLLHQFHICIKYTTNE